MTHRADLVAQLNRTDPTSPALTYYAGDGSCERIELSRRVVGTWVAKAASLLQDELDVGIGGVVLVDLPTHWRLAYWAGAVWSVGASLVLPGAPDVGPVDVEVSTSSASRDVGAARVVVTLPALARQAPEPPPLDAIDEARELPGYPDQFMAFEAPDPDSVAVAGPAGIIRHGDPIDTPWPAGSRVYTGTRDPGRFLDVLASAWAVSGSVVLAPDFPDLESLLVSERVTERAT